MTDVFESRERSSIMRLIKSKGNKSTELKIILYFKVHSIKGWRRNYKVVGHPDFAFPEKRVLIFTDGCFWHGHNCRMLKPKDNAAYWEKKINATKIRDQRITDLLTQKGWKVIRIWECELRSQDITGKKLSILKSD